MNGKKPESLGKYGIVIVFGTFLTVVLLYPSLLRDFKSRSVWLLCFTVASTETCPLVTPAGPSCVFIWYYIFQCD